MGAAGDVKGMREVLGALCKGVRMARRKVADLEYFEQSGPVAEHLDKMLALCGVFCDYYNKLRSLMGELEAAVEPPESFFYVEPYEMTGVPKAKHGQCLLAGRTHATSDINH